MHTVLAFNTRNELTAHFHAQGESDPEKYYFVEREMMLYKGDISRKGFVVQDNNGTVAVYPGDKLFHLRTTHGLPIGDALQRIITANLTVTWIPFIQEARKNGWYDFQSLEAIEQAWVDADLPKHEIGVIMVRLKQWIVENPLVGEMP